MPHLICVCFSLKLELLVLAILCDQHVVMIWLCPGSTWDLGIQIQVLVLAQETLYPPSIYLLSPLCHFQ